MSLAAIDEFISRLKKASSAAYAAFNSADNPDPELPVVNNVNYEINPGSLEAKLADSEASQTDLRRKDVLSALLSLMPSAVVQTDCSPEQIILNVNPAFLTLYGYTSIDQIIGQPISILRPEDTSDQFLMNQIYTDTLSGINRNDRVVNVDSEGNKIPIQIHTSAICDEEGNPKSLIATMFDLRSIEEREILATLRFLADGAFHDINNALTIALGNLDIYKTAITNVFEDKNLTALSTALDRATAIVHRVRTFRANSIQTEIIYPVEQVSTYVDKIFQAGINNTGISLDTSYNSYKPICVDQNLLERSIVNLIINAAHAIENPSRGRVKLSIVDEILTNRVICYNGRQVQMGEEYVTITVEDNGCGISPEVMGRMFEARYTTRSADKGSGLGLAVVKHFFNNHPGTYLAVESEVGVGTKFTLYFPVATEEPAIVESK